MVAHERHVTVTADGQVTVSGLPVRAGQRVRVTVAITDADRQELAARFSAFTKNVQGLPHVQALTDEEIAEEIAANRKSRGAA